MMDGKQFGALALQLIEQSQVPGNALDVAMQFRDAARALAEGRMTLDRAQLKPVAVDDDNLPKLSAGCVG